LGRHQEALEVFLHASLNNPHAAAILLDRKKPKPINHTEVEDHNNGIDICRLLPRFFQMQSKQSRKFFKKLSENKTLKELLDTAHECTRKHSANKDTRAHRENFDRLQELKSPAFAQKKAWEILAEF